MGDFTINGNRESRRISCMIVDSDKMDTIIVKQAINKKSPCDVFLISTYFISIYFFLYYISLFYLLRIWHPLRVILESSLINKSNKSSQVHGCNGGASRTTTSSGTPNHKVKSTCYPPRQRRNIFSVPEYEELKRQCTLLKG